MTISWITPSYFIDVDMPIIVELQKTETIYWQITAFGQLTNDERKFVESNISNCKNLKVEYVSIPYAFYSLKVISIYQDFIERAKSNNPDVIYTSFQAAPYGPILYRQLPLCKTVAACHNVSTPQGANQEHYARMMTYLHLKTFKNIQVFSESQEKILKSKFSNKNVLLAPLAIKDYGEPTIKERAFDPKCIKFLFFGNILGYKRVDLLIEASQILYEQGYQNFKVKIVGKCKNWAEYEHMIKYPKIFETRIERIPNEDVADAFADSDYFVMPYQDIAQSGAITVAFRYNLPIILSDLDQFKPFAIDGKTGLFFEQQNVNDLVEKMKLAIDGGSSLYTELKDGLSDFVLSKYSTPAIAQMYLKYFNELSGK